MLKIELDKAAGVAILEPQGALTEQDFEQAARVIDPYLEQHEMLFGLIIYVEDFPGWESFAALIKHFKFVKDHHHKLAHVAVVTDAAIGTVAEKIASHFIAAKVKHFPYSQFADAKIWMLQAEA